MGATSAALGRSRRGPLGPYRPSAQSLRPAPVLPFPIGLSLVPFHQPLAPLPLAAAHSALPSPLFWAWIALPRKGAGHCRVWVLQ